MTISTPSDEECALFAQRLDRAEAQAIAEINEKEWRAVSNQNTENRSIVWGISDASCIIALRMEPATGMRRSEVCGLTWANADIPGRTITVRQNIIEERAGKGTYAIKVKGTKTYASTRKLTFDEARQATSPTGSSSRRT